MLYPTRQHNRKKLLRLLLYRVPAAGPLERNAKQIRQGESEHSYCCAWSRRITREYTNTSSSTPRKRECAFSTNPGCETKRLPDQGIKTKKKGVKRHNDRVSFPRLLGDNKIRRYCLVHKGVRSYTQGFLPRRLTLICQIQRVPFSGGSQCGKVHKAANAIPGAFGVFRYTPRNIAR